MSDDSYTTGEVRITPPLRWREVKESDFIAANGRRGQSVVFTISVEKTENDEGDEVVIRSCPSIVANHSGRGVSGSIASNLREIVKTHPDHVFEGEFITYPETGMESFPTRVLVNSSEVLEQKIDPVWVADES